MHRTQILLEDWQYEALKAMAARRGMSLDALVREVLTEKLCSKSRGKDPEPSHLERIAGVIEGPGDLAERHDRFLYGEGTSESGSR